MRFVVIVSFLDEAGFLPLLLPSVAQQSELPTRLVLVDDGSRDASAEIALAFAAAKDWVTVLQRPRRPAAADRLARAAELQSFRWALGHVEEDCDVVVKLDADLQLHPELFRAVRLRFEDDPRLGITGSVLSVRTPHGLRREQHPTDHVRGPNKFYRRACLEEIAPLPPYLGWDTIDELRGRLRGWRTEGFELPGGETIHLRPTGLHDGRLRAYRRWGTCAWGYGASPSNVVLGAASRARRPPYGLTGLSYLAGYVHAALRGHPRAEPEVRRLVKRETAQRVRRRLGGGGPLR